MRRSLSAAALAAALILSGMAGGAAAQSDDLPSTNSADVSAATPPNDQANVATVGETDQAAIGEDAQATANDESAPSDEAANAAISPSSADGNTAISPTPLKHDGFDINSFFLAIGLVAAVLFFVPTWIAYSRRSRHRLIILIVNVAFGWTGVGWLVTLAMAVWPKGDAVPVTLRSDPDAPQPPLAEGMKRQILELEKLGELKAAGLLSDAEFIEKKSKIISSI